MLICRCFNRFLARSTRQDQYLKLYFALIRSTPLLALTKTKNIFKKLKTAEVFILLNDYRISQLYTSTVLNILILTYNIIIKANISEYIIYYVH